VVAVQLGVRDSCRANALCTHVTASRARHRQRWESERRCWALSTQQRQSSQIKPWLFALTSNINVAIHLFSLLSSQKLAVVVFWSSSLFQLFVRRIEETMASMWTLSNNLVLLKLCCRQTRLQLNESGVTNLNTTTGRVDYRAFLRTQCSYHSPCNSSSVSDNISSTLSFISQSLSTFSSTLSLNLIKSSFNSFLFSNGKSSISNMQ